MDRRLPTYFERLANGRVFVSSVSGNWRVLEDKEFEALSGDIKDLDESQRNKYYALGIIEPGNTRAIERLEGIRIRDSYKCYEDSFSYFIVVGTLRCNQTCEYCQVSRRPESSHEKYDLNTEDASAISSLISSSPRQHIKVEFQGGESTLNISFISSLITKLKTSDKEFSFVITTNLVSLTDEILDLCKKHSIDLSISIDGPEDVHTANRTHPNKEYFKDIIKNIDLARKQLGKDRVNAVCTLSKSSLSQVTRIPLFYKKMNFHYLSLRHITEIGFARNHDGYTFDEWFAAFKEGLDTIIKINQSGYFLVEGISELYLQKLFGSRRNVFVDMHNPIAMGANAVVINYDGEVYLSDESRMLAEEGDNSLSFGLNIRNQKLSCQDILSSKTAVEVIRDSQIISSPICASCAYQSHCGNDLVHNYNISGDFIGYKPFSFICQRTKSVIEHILELYEDPAVAKVFNSWIPRN